MDANVISDFVREHDEAVVRAKEARVAAAIHAAKFRQCKADMDFNAAVISLGAAHDAQQTANDDVEKLLVRHGPGGGRKVHQAGSGTEVADLEEAKILADAIMSTRGASELARALLKAPRGVQVRSLSSSNCGYEKKVLTFFP